MLPQSRSTQGGTKDTEYKLGHAFRYAGQPSRPQSASSSSRPLSRSSGLGGFVGCLDLSSSTNGDFITISDDEDCAEHATVAAAPAQHTPAAAAAAAAAQRRRQQAHAMLGLGAGGSGVY